jgi:hypothetical protein
MRSSSVWMVCRVTLRILASACGLANSMFDTSLNPSASALWEPSYFASDSKSYSGQVDTVGLHSKCCFQALEAAGPAVHSRLNCRCLGLRPCPRCSAPQPHCCLSLSSSCAPCADEHVADHHSRLYKEPSCPSPETTQQIGSVHSPAGPQAIFLSRCTSHLYLQVKQN